MEEIKKVIRGEVLDLKNLSLPYKDKIAKQWKNIDIRQIVVKKWNGSILRRQYMLRETIERFKRNGSEWWNKKISVVIQKEKETIYVERND